MSPRVIAIDWSGSITTAAHKIWLAEAIDGRLVRLENGRHREDVAGHLIAEAQRGPELVIGLDFAFSLPAWFLAEHGLNSAAELWDLADREADGWLSDPPFWGKPGCKKPDLIEHYRRTELQAPPTRGIRPKSVFQVGGAGAVGTGSLRGMRLLRTLRTAGFTIWPFDPPGWPRVIEIYPRLLTGPVSKCRPEARAAYMDTRYPELPNRFRHCCVASDDAFDAAASALAMSRHVDELTSLPAVDGDIARLEGAIWYPRAGAGVR
jgi:hypothetical protein